MKHVEKRVLIITLCLFETLLGNAQILSSDQTEAKKTVVGKIFFSTRPFTNSSAGAKNQFSSSDFIYARLETNGKKFNDFLEMPLNDKEKIHDRWFLFYVVRVYKDGVLAGVNRPCKTWVLNQVAWNTTSLNFDVMPGPQNVSTEMSAESPESYDPARFPSYVGPLYTLITSNIFSETGNYKIKVEVFDVTMDDWQKLDPAPKWPSFEGEFDFAFNTADIKNIKENETAANKVLKASIHKSREEASQIESNKIRKAYFDKTEPPDGWTLKSNALGGGMTMDQIKKHFNNNTVGATILKVYATQSGGWGIEKNQFGIPKNKFLDQEIRIFYKQGNDTCGCKTIYVTQPYLGGGNYGKTTLDLFSASPFSCAKLK